MSDLIARGPVSPGKREDDQAGWHGPPPLADRACRCPARPLVRVLVPPTGAWRLPVDLLLCGHHYLRSRTTLAAAGAVVLDETGAIVHHGVSGA